MQAWARRFVVAAIIGFATFAAHEHADVALVSLLVVAISAAAVIVSENA